jgi:hypothetical protein
MIAIAIMMMGRARHDAVILVLIDEYEIGVLLAE